MGRGQNGNHRLGLRQQQPYLAGESIEIDPFGIVFQQYRDKVRINFRHPLRQLASQPMREGDRPLVRRVGERRAETDEQAHVTKGEDQRRGQIGSFDQRCIFLGPIVNSYRLNKYVTS